MAIFFELIYIFYIRVLVLQDGDIKGKMTDASSAIETFDSKMEPITGKKRRAQGTSETSSK